MSLHVFGAIVTGVGCAANNRGETEGNITTLQKLLWNGQVHTTVSAEAIRWAIRYYWQTNGVPVNREWDDQVEDHKWKDDKWKCWTKVDGLTFIDDDLLGFMKAEGSKVEGEKGSTAKRRGVFEISRAISTIPFAGDISFNAKSGEKGRTSLYGTEMHATRYQFGFAMTPERLRVKERCLLALDALVSLGGVAGNHSRFLFDFSPESVILRVTDDPAPRILYVYSEQDGQIAVPDLKRKLKAKDILPDELFIGGIVSKCPEISSTNIKNSYPGVKEAIQKCKESIKERLGLEEKHGKRE